MRFFWPLCSQVPLLRSISFRSNLQHFPRVTPVQLIRNSYSMDSNLESQYDQFVKQLYVDANSGKRTVCSVYVTGGGVNLLSWLLSVPGGSSTVSNMQVPYSRASLKKLLSKYETEGNTDYNSLSLCSQEVSMKLAKAAYTNAMENLLVDEPSVLLQSDNLKVFGIGCTAALASNVPKKGEHRCYVSTFSGNGFRNIVINLKKGLRNRREEDEMCSTVMLNEMALQCGGLPFSTEVSLDDEVSQSIDVPIDLMDTMLSHGRQTTLFPTPGNPDVNQWIRVENYNVPTHTLVIPGSFNPLHEGHIAMAISALKKLQSMGVTVPLILFEIAAVNADKPPIPKETILQRIGQFDTSLPLFSELKAFNIPIAVAITSLPLFVSKAEVFRDSYFVIGADTFCRLMDLKYYKPPSTCSDINLLIESDVFNATNFYGLSKAMSLMESSGAKFVVGGRVSDPSHLSGVNEGCSNIFQTMAEIVTNNHVARLVTAMNPAMFISLNETEFRIDISSTLIRNKKLNNCN